jgi:hypothetical protein
MKNNFEYYKKIEQQGIDSAKQYIQELFHEHKVEFEDTELEQDKLGVDSYMYINYSKFAIDFKICEDKQYYWNKYNSGDQDILIEKQQSNGKSWIDHRNENIWIAYAWPTTDHTKYKKLIMIHMSELSKIIDYAIEKKRPTYKTTFTNTDNWFFKIRELDKLNIKYYSL